MKSLLTLAFAAFSLISASAASALSMAELRAVPNLTPENFASYFSSFKFVFRADIQNPADFLASQAGDCDDFSTFAASELAARGYTPRLVTVRMKKEAHVICYIAESNGYLDYNLRARGGLVPSGPGLTQIADAVAKSFKNAAWTSVSEFTYTDGVKRLVKTTLPTNRMTASAPPVRTSNQ